MAKSLFIAEKPSVAQEFMKALGKTASRRDGYAESEDSVFTWCVGHLVGLAQADAYDEKYKKWNYSDLPILPDRWEYQVSESTKKQFKVLKELMKREDVSSLVEATDVG